MSDATTLSRIHTAALGLRQELSRWLEQSSRVDGPQHNHGGEDEANYALAWFPHYLVTGEAAILARFESLLGDLLTWVHTEGHHGYEAEAEAHHGTEPFLLFLPRYLGLRPDHAEARAALEDAAHHIGNWVDEVPAWYDYGRDLFRSWQIGSRVVGADPRFDVEVAEHLRFIHIALAAHRVLGDGAAVCAAGRGARGAGVPGADGYLEWALRYGRKRAERLLAARGEVPLAWDLQGGELHWDDVRHRPGMRGMVALDHKIDGDPLAGVENHLASGAVQCFGDLYEASGQEIFRDAARRLVVPILDQIGDPFGDVSAVAIAHYRQVFDDPAFDAELMKAVDRFPPSSDAPLVMMLPEEAQRREPGPGKRADMLYWGAWAQDGSAQPLRQPPTAALALAYQLTGDLTYAERAFDLAARKFAMARRVLRSGREHADMGGAICSVAAGHGRNWGAGAVTGCYGPLLLGARDAFGQVRPTVRFADADSPDDRAHPGPCDHPDDAGHQRDFEPAGTGDAHRESGRGDALPAGRSPGDPSSTHRSRSPRARPAVQRLPPRMLSLVRPAVGGAGELLLYNAGDEDGRVTWWQERGVAHERHERHVRLAAGETQRFVLHRAGEQEEDG